MYDPHAQIELIKEQLKGMKEQLKTAQTKLQAEGEAPAREVNNLMSEAINRLREHEKIFSSLPLDKIPEWATKQRTLEDIKNAYERKNKEADKKRQKLQEDVDGILLAIGRGNEALADAKKAALGMWQGSIPR
jgi:hypothetical protein